MPNGSGTLAGGVGFGFFGPAQLENHFVVGSGVGSRSMFARRALRNRASNNAQGKPCCILKNCNTYKSHIRYPICVQDKKDKYGYLYDIVDDNYPTIIWIPGGGLSGLLFAFSGTGPFIINNKNIISNNNIPENKNQLFLDVLGTGLYNYTDYENTYPKTDDELTTTFCYVINKIFNNRPKLKKEIILVGVSYGGKIAVKISKKLHEDFNIKKIIGVTPFYNPIQSASFIPYPGNRLQYYYLNQTDKNYLNSLDSEFEMALENSNWKDGLNFMGEGGIYAKFTENLLSSTNINIWNINTNNIATMGSWFIPNEMKKIKNFLYDKFYVINHYPYLKHLYLSNLSKLNIDNDFLLNINFWNTLAYADCKIPSSFLEQTVFENNSETNKNCSHQPPYLTTEDISNLPAPLTIVTGEYDVITSFDGLFDLYKNTNKEQIYIKSSNYFEYYYNKNNKNDLYKIRKGTHLLCMNNGNIMKYIFDII